MLTRHYSGEQRRAINMVWNAAGQYEADPPFLAFWPGGRADFYMNTVIGLALRWLDMKKLARFFASYAGSPRAERFDEICWLGIENCVYGKELPERPVLAFLRREHADDFFRGMENLSQQEMMTKNMAVYEQQQARWAAVSGRKLPYLTPGAAKLFRELQLSPALDTDGVIDALEDILIGHFHFGHFSAGGDTRGFSAGYALGNVLRALLHREVRHVDSAIVRMTPDEKGGGADVHGASLREKHTAAKSAEDEAYIRACFGKSILNEKDRRFLENALCTGPHADCRLWVTRGDPDEAGADIPDAVRVARDSEKQRKKNEDFIAHSSVAVASGIRRLSAEIDGILASRSEPLPVRAKAGRLDPTRAWRLPVLSDPRVFEKPGDETEPDVTVDLLLDASASRLGSQEVTAAQSLVLAESLRRCRVPVRVSAFRSLRGHTVIQILKDYGEKDVRRLSRYYAAGWNRDGLALRAAAALMETGGSRGGFTAEGAGAREKTFSDGVVRVLIILTDAHPDDSTEMPPEAGSPFRRDYTDFGAVKDTADAVADLRKREIRVGALYLGPDAWLDNARAIYGDLWVRIHRSGQLAEGVSGLLERILRDNG